MRGLVTCQGWIVMAMVSCVWIWITIQSLWTVECPHTSLHTQPQSPWSPSVLWTSDICILTFCILQCSAVCRSCCSLFTIGHRFTAELLGLQVSGQYAACGHQWLIMSEPCHRDIHRSRRILVRSMAQFTFVYSQILTHDEKLHYKS